ncbi:MAG: transposase, partial [Gammaproteobacteria bacterium]|nr:transposase [Gammaproteobacteria bacterium]
ILEQNWGQFIQQLAYKAESAGGKLVKVDPNNTTQRCSACDALPQEKLTLADRWYYCSTCGHSEDRDINAAKNILLKGLEALNLGGSSPGAWVEGRETERTGAPSTQNSSLSEPLWH